MVAFATWWWDAFTDNKNTQIHLLNGSRSLAYYTLFAFKSSSSASYFNKRSIERQNKTLASVYKHAFPQMQLTVQ
jgi:hypothetical protein